MNELGETSHMITQGGFWMAGVKTFAMLCIVLAILILALYLVKRFLYPREGLGAGQLIKVLSSSHVSSKGRVALVDVAGEKLVLGITSDNISCLARIEDPEAVARIDGSRTSGAGGNIFERLVSGNLKDRGRSRDS